MPTLHLIRLKCIETEDTFGSDEAYLTVNDQRVWGPMSMNDGQEKEVDVNRIFSYRAVVRLYDEDTPDKDDFLGVLMLSQADANGEEREHYFRQDGANYRLTYRVSMNPSGTAIRRKRREEQRQRR